LCSANARLWKLYCFRGAGFFSNHKKFMKIGIVGLGIVGSAIKYGFERLGHQISTNDIKDGGSLADVVDTEIVYLCLPTPQSESGHCDTSAIENVAGKLINTHNFNGIIAVKSTVSPGTTENLRKQFPGALICHVPEFLRERAAIVDFTDNHDVCVIGTDSNEVFEAVKTSHGHYPKKFVRMSPTEAEVSKYFNNVYNAALITFANAFYEVCKASGADYTVVKNAMVQRDHIFDKYLDCNENLRGFGGMCLPKDTSAMTAFAQDHNLPIDLFRAIVNDNNRYEKTVFEGMRT
jgi:UDPglucose 6-dehydrogenase